jgi:hypothetical protein
MLHDNSANGMWGKNRERAMRIGQDRMHYPHVHIPYSIF